ncbi:MAG: 50S ribosomal protein L18e [Candidatus Nanohaloarchaeota archaeon QJJ-9]|nr:50S ribosomal protein L18e [Candidatus Nanohaloarchaeota archaeon QJJ-9]
MEKTNPVLRETIIKLEKAARKNDAPVYEKAAEELKSSKRKQVEVNLSKLERKVEDGETVLIPGKVLGAGQFNKDAKISAFKFTDSAKQDIEEEGEAYFIQDLIEENPEGEKVKVIK